MLEELLFAVTGALVSDRAERSRKIRLHTERSTGMETAASGTIQ